MPVTFFKKLLGRGRGPKPPLKVAAGSTSQFPIISHTFVYQELTALHEMLGADVKLFHTQAGDPEALHAAFRYLDQNRHQFESSWDRHAEDFEYFKTKVPDRVESLVAALSEESGIPPEELTNRYEFRLAFTYARLVEEWGAHYVHTYFFYDQALNGLVASWLLGLPRGLSTYADHMMDDWPLKVTRLHLRTADVIVATSRRIAGELVEIAGKEIEAKIVVKPNGVDGRRFPVVPRTAVENRPLNLVCMTRIEPKKGMLELADATRMVLDRGIPVEVHIIGSADPGNEVSEAYAADFEARIEALGVGDAIIRHGRMKQEAMAPILRRADAFVAPFVETESGDKDGIPTAILEGMSSALPVIGTDAGSIPEIFDDGVEGYIVPQKDAAALADAIVQLASEPRRALDFGQRARQRFEREFDIRATEPRLHALVRDAVERKGARVV